jgi:phosphohistidine phosphatase
MKQLVLLRHAKSSWSGDFADHDRRLNGRGEGQAPQVGLWLREQNLTPGLILSSTARRAATTAAVVASASGYGGVLHVTPRLYLTGAAEHLAVVRELGGAADRVLLVGHNPGLEEFFDVLVVEPRELRTAAAAVIELQIYNWADLCGDRSGSLRTLWRPERGD